MTAQLAPTSPPAASKKRAATVNATWLNSRGVALRLDGKGFEGHPLEPFDRRGEKRTAKRCQFCRFRTRHEGDFVIDPEDETGKDELQGISKINTMKKHFSAPQADVRCLGRNVCLCAKCITPFHTFRCPSHVRSREPRAKRASQESTAQPAAGGGRSQAGRGTAHAKWPVAHPPHESS